jgi:hypothetical protein
MDAKYYNGDDDREFSPPPGEDEDDSCDVCGAHSSEPCAWDCTCQWCEERFGRVPEKTA